MLYHRILDNQYIREVVGKNQETRELCLKANIDPISDYALYMLYDELTQRFGKEKSLYVSLLLWRWNQFNCPYYQIHPKMITRFNNNSDYLRFPNFTETEFHGSLVLELPKKANLCIDGNQYHSILLDVSHNKDNIKQIAIFAFSSDENDNVITTTYHDRVDLLDHLIRIKQNENDILLKFTACILFQLKYDKIERSKRTGWRKLCYNPINYNIPHGRYGFQI